VAKEDRAPGCALLQIYYTIPYAPYKNKPLIDIKKKKGDLFVMF
jgi:hypothetical protein